MFAVYCTSPSLMWKSFQANLSGGLPFLTGYHRICAIRGTVAEVASAVVAVADTAPDTVGVTTSTDRAEPDSALSELSTSIFHFLVQCGVLLEDALEHSLSNGLDGASKIDRFPHPPSVWVVRSDWMIFPGTQFGAERKFFTITDCPIVKAHGQVCLSWCSFCQDCCWLTLCSRSVFRRSHRVRRLQPSVIR